MDQRAKISEVEVFGLNAKQNSVPKWLKPHEDGLLWSYQLFLRYRGTYSRSSQSPEKSLYGRCVLALSTKIKRYGDLVMVKGHIRIFNYSQSKPSDINFVPKQKISCPWLERLVAEYISRSRIPDHFFDNVKSGIVKHPLFSCDRNEVALVYAYNPDGSLDRVSMDMSLFKPVDS